MHPRDCFAIDCPRCRNRILLPKNSFNEPPKPEPAPDAQLELDFEGTSDRAQLEQLRRALREVGKHFPETQQFLLDQHQIKIGDENE